MRLNEFGRGFFVAGLVWSVTAAAWAVPYAANVRNTGGTNWEFVLNEAASNVTITRDGGNALDLGAIGVGRHTFNMGSFSTWSIAVTQDTSVAAWTEIGDAEANQFQHFEQPVALAVNSNPANGAYFGTIYVVNSRANATGSGRDMGEGIYAHTSDRIGVDLFTDNTFTPTLSFDSSWARKPGFTASLSGTNSPWKMELDDAGNIVIADWTDTNGGIKYANRDLANGGIILAGDGDVAPNQSGRTGGWVGPNGPVHGSIASDFRVDGTIGQSNFKVWAIDEDLQTDLNPNPTTAHGNQLWRWDVGSATAYDGVPQLEKNLGSTGTNPLPLTSDSRPNWVLTNAGTAANVYYSDVHDNWYLTVNRGDGNEAGLIVLEGTTKSLLWSSLQFSVDNNLDGNNALATGGAGCTGASCSIQDIFRGMGGDLVVSPDGDFLYAQQTDRGAVNRGNNPVLGTHVDADPALAGEIKVIPLDANGLPMITVAGGEITNMQSISYGSNIGPGTTNVSSRRALAVDAAGNVYISDANDFVERMKVFTPGGATIATTTATSFTVSPIVDDIPGDHNLDGTVDAADYVMWRKQNPGAPNTHQGYVDWLANFGEPLPGSGGNSAVPEPASIALVLCGLVGLALSRRGR